MMQQRKSDRQTANQGSVLDAHQRDEVARFTYRAVHRFVDSDDLSGASILAVISIQYGQAGLAECAANIAQIVLSLTPEEMRDPDNRPLVHQLLPSGFGADQCECAHRYVLAWHADDPARAREIFESQAGDEAKLIYFITLLAGAATAAAGFDEEAITFLSR